MSLIDADTLYALLPATVRMRDNGALKELIGVLAGQAAVVDENLEQLYDDLFIQTCAPWAIPYIGNLIGYRSVRPIPPRDAMARSEVADTIGIRRRKGTLTVLDQLAADVTEWPAVAVEFFQRLAVSQYVRNHVRSMNTCVDVHGWQPAADVNGAFDLMPRTVDVRRIASGRGRHNLPNVGVFVWRRAALGGATLLTAQAPALPRAISIAGRLDVNRFTFDPFGDDVPLVNPPQPPEKPFTLTERRNLPFALRRFALHAELERLRAAAAHTLGSYEPLFFGLPPVLVIWDRDGTPIDPVRICACDLTMWTPPSDPAIRVAVDPELGRLVFNGSPPDPVRVAYAYAFSGRYGGGAYRRQVPASEGPAQTVSAFEAADPGGWSQGVFEIADSGSFGGDLSLSPTGPLVLRAADFVRPIVLGQVTIDALPGGTVTLRGLGIRDGLVVRRPGHAGPGSSSASGSSSSSSSSGAASGSSSSSSSAGAEPPGPDDATFTLVLEHCTLRGPLLWSFDEGGSLTIRRSLCAALNVDERVAIQICDSAVDAGIDSAAAIAGQDGAGSCGEVNLSACTVIGVILARETSCIENSLLCGRVTLERTQAGCVRYSRVPIGSSTPRRFRCQPDLAIDAAIAAAASEGPPPDAAAQQAIRDIVSMRTAPVFVSTARSEPGYLQLSDDAPHELVTGAESEDEMGLFHGLYNGRRESNLNYRLSEYLRIGLESGVIHAS